MKKPSILIRVSNITHRYFRDLVRPLYYSSKKLQGGSDLARWSKMESFHFNWDQRTLMLAAHVPEDSVVLEFGAGRLFLKGKLPQGCTYMHSDIVERNKDTLVIDLNKELPALPKVDVMLFSGVLEYLKDAPSVLEHCSRFTSQILFSYATADKIVATKKRRHHGWISDLKEGDFFDFAQRNAFSIKKLDMWQDQTLFSMTIENSAYGK